MYSGWSNIQVLEHCRNIGETTKCIDVYDNDYYTLHEQSISDNNLPTHNKNDDVNNDQHYESESDGTSITMTRVTEQLQESMWDA